MKLTFTENIPVENVLVKNIDLEKSLGKFFLSDSYNGRRVVRFMRDSAGKIILQRTGLFKPVAPPVIKIKDVVFWLGRNAVHDSDQGLNVFQIFFRPS